MTKDIPIWHRCFRFLLCCLALAGQTITALAQPRTVVEFFTSQSCRVCVPADKLAMRLAKDPNLLVLSFNVDYWDYLGWHDTFSKPEFTQRQRVYSRTRGDKNIYTPQVVVNGRNELAGAAEPLIMARLNSESGDRERIFIEPKVRLTPNQLEADFGRGQLEAGWIGTIWLISYRHRADVEVHSQTAPVTKLSYANVVTSITAVGVWNGEPMSIAVPKDSLFQNGNDGVAIVVQLTAKGKLGPIIGAVDIEQSSI